VGDRRDDPFRERVLDDEREQRLRQEPRLEGAAAVLVGDATLAPVPDRLDDRDADVAGLLLDGVDHRLDPLLHDHRLDLDHPVPFRWTTKKSPATSRGARPPRPGGPPAPGQPPKRSYPGGPAGPKSPGVRRGKNPKPRPR